MQIYPKSYIVKSKESNNAKNMPYYKGLELIGDA